MSSKLTDMEEWRSAWGPSLRVFGYISVFFLLYYIIVAIAFYGGLTPITWLLGFLAPIYIVFSAILSIFKVLEEQKPPGVVQLM